MKNKIEKEYQDFKKNVLDGTLTELYQMAGKVFFYQNVWDYYQNCEDTPPKVKKELKNTSLTKLYFFYLKYERMTVESWEEIREMVEMYWE